MGEIKKHYPVKLIVGMITPDPDLFSSVEEILKQRFGIMDFYSDIMPFDFTKYYIKEMGENLLRKFIGFEKLILPEELVEIKYFTNDIEKEFLLDGSSKRRINLDPGYITPAKLILASTKDHIHRIYLRDGIYAEITLQMEGGTFRPWQWTYPDYRSEGYIKIFNEIRELYMQQLRNDGISSNYV
jgi:hypothetical protein